MGAIPVRGWPSASWINASPLGDLTILGNLAVLGYLVIPRGLAIPAIRVDLAMPPPMGSAFWTWGRDPVSWRWRRSAWAPPTSRLWRPIRLQWTMPVRPFAEMGWRRWWI